MTRRYAIVGTFDVSNFGDLLFPLAAQAALAERLGDVQVVAYSYRSMGSADWFYEVRPLQRLVEDLPRFDGLIIGGGLIVRGDTGITAGYMPTDVRQHHPLSLWLLPTIAAQSIGVPVAYNAPGVLAGIPPELAPLIDLTLGAVAHMAVRDITSALRLQSLAPSAALRVVPDSIFDIPSLLPDAPSPGFLHLERELGLDQPYVVVQPSGHAEQVPHHLAPVLQAARDHGCRIVELPIGPVNGDRVGRSGLSTDAAVEPWPHPLVVAEVIARSQAVVGDSLHLSIVATASGVPVYRPRRQAGKHSEALNGLQRMYEWNPEVEAAPSDRWTDFARREPGQDIAERRAQVRAHWDSVIRVLSSAPDEQRTAAFRASLPTAFGMTLQRWQKRLHQLERERLAELETADHRFRQAEEAHRGSDEDFARRLQASEIQLQAMQEQAERQRLQDERTSELVGELEAARQRLRDGLAEADEARTELSDLRRSIGMRVVQRYQRGLDRLVPPGSRRRTTYLSIVHAREGGEGQRGPDRAPARPLAVPTALDTSAHPVVTVVIPVHGQWWHTASCLAALARDVPVTPWEVVVVDDASSDGTREELARISGVRTVPLDLNVGFVKACNAGIAASRGQYLVLLNNDTEPEPGWLDSLVRTAEADETVGVVGAKLVYGDGRLQEAGGIIWSDGDGWNYGRFGDPDDPAYEFVRDVDYCSGAALLVRRSLLDALGGGLDERYAPAYYEDTDLCFAAREHGLRVVYQPASVVVHHEGISHGTDVVGTGVKRYQAINREKFLERWAGALAEQHPHDAALAPLARSRGRRGRVLVVDHHVPTYDRDSGSVRMWALLRLLREDGYDVTFVPENKARMEPYTTAMQQAGIEVLYGHLDLETRLAELGPGTVLAVLSRARVAADHLDLVRRAMPNVPIVYDTVDLHHLREQRRAELEGDDELGRTAQRLRQQELGLVARTDATVVVADYERDALLKELPGAQVLVVGNVHEARADVPGPVGRAGLLFVGNFRHDPNVDAVVWFAREVLPLVRLKRPDTVLTVVGGDLVAEVQALDGNVVRVLGWVPELAPHYDAARAVVVPLRYGAGVKGKVGEALKEGVPVVSTSIGAEGMGLQPGAEVLVAETPEQQAEAILRVLEDDRLWGRLSEAGRKAVECRYGLAPARAALAGVLAAVVA